MTAWRSPQVEMLYEVLKGTDWAELEKNIATWHNHIEPDARVLTLEELHERIGKPVWTILYDGSGGAWGIMHYSNTCGLYAVVSSDECRYFEQEAMPTIAYDPQPRKAN